jgi:hypothetical protein
MDSKTVSITANQSTLAGLGGGSKGDGRLRPRYCMVRSPRLDRGIVNSYPPSPEANPRSVELRVYGSTARVPRVLG